MSLMPASAPNSAPQPAPALSALYDRLDRAVGRAIGSTEMLESIADKAMGPTPKQGGVSGGNASSPPHVGCVVERFNALLERLEGTLNRQRDEIARLNGFV